MYNYSVEIEEKYLKDIKNLNLKDLKISDGKIIFRTNRKTLNILKNKFDYIYFVDIYKTKLKFIFSKRLGAIFGILLMILMILLMSKTITKIDFLSPDTYDLKVEKFILDELAEIGKFKYLNQSLNSLDKKLKKEFFHYEWISISKKGTTLIIEISPSFLDDKIVDNLKSGSLYAKKDAIVKKYHVEKGILVVQEEQYVKKGDLLISGDIVNYDKTIEKVKPKGYVIGEVLEYKDIKIPKIKKDNIRNGKILTEKKIFLKNKQLGKNKYSEKDYEIKTLFNLFDIFKINMIYYYLSEDIVTNLSLLEAKNYGRSIIYRDFLENKTNELEKVLYIKYVKHKEDNNYYYLRYIIKSEETISQFLTN